MLHSVFFIVRSQKTACLLRPLYFIGICYALAHSAIIVCANSADQNTKEFDQNFNKAVEQAKSTYTGAGSMLKGFGSMVGIVSKEYEYSFKVVNDTPSVVEVEEKKIVPAMGARFTSTRQNGIVLPPFANSGSTFLNQHLYLSIGFFNDASDAQVSRFPKNAQEYQMFANKTRSRSDVSDMFRFYYQKITEWKAHDTNIYIYRIFSKNGQLRGENLDVKGESTQFNGQFYNSTDRSLVLEYVYDDILYRALIGPNSFALLQSTKKIGSVRPPFGTQRGFQLYEIIQDQRQPFAYIPVPSVGLGNVVSKEVAGKQELHVENSALYAYKIYQSSAGGDLHVDTQGMTIGMFDQPINNRIRDISPVPCHIWVKSAAQAEQQLKKSFETEKKVYTPDYATIFIDEPHTVWLGYITADFEYFKKLVPGTPLSCSLLRPRIAEEKAWLYIVALNTDKEEQARIFLKKLNAGDIGKKAFFTAIKNPLDAQQVSNIQPNMHGTIEDTVLKLKGVVLAADIFTPYGVGSGPFYYMINPPSLRVDQFAQIISFSEKWYNKNAQGGMTLNPTVMQELSDNLRSWIVRYQTEKAGVAQELEKYLISVGDQTMVKEGKLTEIGNRLYQLLLEGPVGIKNYPVLRKAGINYFVFGFGAKPEDWPET